MGDYFLIIVDNIGFVNDVMDYNVWNYESI